MRKINFKNSFVLLTAIVLITSGFFMFTGTASATSMNLPVVTSGGQNIYIYPTANNSLNAAWGCQGTVSGAQSGTDGSGNTAAILAACNDTDNDGTAADICADLNEGAGYDGYTDWYLPALDQLATINTEITANRLYKGDYAGTWAPFLSGFGDAYWSSTEYWYSDSANEATYHMFSNNSWFFQTKDFGYRVRCVRSDSNTTYAVTYSANASDGGTVPTDSYPYKNGATATALGNTGSLIKTNYTFVGWNTADDGSGDTYQSANTFTMGSANVTLYAQWAPATYAVADGTMTRVSGDTTSTVNIDATPAAVGSTVTLTVTPKAGMRLKAGTLTATYNGAQTATLSGSGPYTFTMPAYAVTVTATFVAIPLELPYITYNGSNLYISPVDNSTGALWGCDGTAIGSGAQSYTDGFNNTAAIMTGCATEDIAADVCTDLNTENFGGYNDWYLPATDQLSAMYDQRNSVNKGAYSSQWTNFVSDGSFYWSSTEWSSLPTDNALAWRFSDGSYAVGRKEVGHPAYVRCVRSSANPVYTVTYNTNGSNGGTVPTDPWAYETGFTVTALGNTGSLVRTGYVFTGWWDLTTFHAASSTFSMPSANVTLYDQWAATYAVTAGTMTRVSGDASSTVNIDATPVTAGSTVTLTIAPKVGMQLKAGTLVVAYNDGSPKTAALSGSGPYTFTMPAYAVTVTATFVTIPPTLMADNINNVIGQRMTTTVPGSYPTAYFDALHGGDIKINGQTDTSYSYGFNGTNFISFAASYFPTAGDYTITITNVPGYADNSVVQTVLTPILVTNILVAGQGSVTSVIASSTLNMVATISPSDVTYSAITWSTTGGSGITINQTGLLSARSYAKGTATVTATAQDGSNVFGSTQITVTIPTCSSVSNAATYNSYPTCGVATCNSGYTLSNGTCVALGGGESGGGGSILLPVAPTANFVNGEISDLAFTINNGAKTTTIPEVNLTLNANPATVRGYIVSLDANFTNVGISPYLNTPATFVLPSKAGSYTLYLKYYSTTGVYSKMYTQSISLQPIQPMIKLPTNTTISIPTTIPHYLFKRALQLGSQGIDVKALQQFLNVNGYILSKNGAGSPGNETTTFGPATKTALIKFQKANKISPAVGYFGPITIGAVNTK